MKRPLFVVFEGLDGSGKSTLMARVKQVLEDAGYEVTSTGQPGGTDISNVLRDIVKYSEEHYPDDPIAPGTEMLLFTAARHQLVETVIKPALEAGHIVLCDRHDWSTYAYQGQSDKYLRCNFSLEPDLIIYHDKQPNDARKAALARGSLDTLERRDDWELKNARYWECISQAMDADKNPLIIDANNFDSPEWREMHNTVASHIMDLATHTS